MFMNLYYLYYLFVVSDGAELESVDCLFDYDHLKICSVFI